MWTVWKKKLALAIRYTNINHNKHKINPYKEYHAGNRVQTNKHTQTNELNLTKNRPITDPTLETIDGNSQIHKTNAFLSILGIVFFSFEFVICVSSHFVSQVGIYYSFFSLLEKPQIIINICDCPSSFVLSTSLLDVVSPFVKSFCPLSKFLLWSFGFWFYFLSIVVIAYSFCACY